MPDGAFVVLLGPSGAGKTTTLRIVSGLDEPDSGEVQIGGRPVNALTPAERNVAMVFQQYSLYPHLSVRENLAFPLKSPLLRMPPAEIERKVGEIAEMLQISHKLDNKATQLSGGEMQRVSIGRALVRNPDVYLMDEPLSSLDAKLRSDLRIELKKIQANSGATLLYVTHDQIEAMTMATHVGVLDEGRMIQFGPPREVYENPVSIRAASRLGQPRINLLPASLFGPALDGAVTIGLRPEQITQGEGEGSLVIACMARARWAIFISCFPVNRHSSSNRCLSSTCREHSAPPACCFGGRVTWVNSQWKLCAYPGHFSVEINKRCSYPSVLLSLWNRE